MGVPGLAFAIVVHSATVTTAEPAGRIYELNPGDRVEIRILERPEVSGEYRVDESGEVSLPGVGRLAAVGLTLREFETTLREAASIGIVSPSVSASLLEMRPVYVLGDVMRGGAFPFRPGLTALQGLALAGGLDRLDTADESFTRTITGLRAEQGELSTMRRLAAQRLILARLRAEQSGMAFEPEGFEDNALLRHERAVFEARREAFERTRRTLDATIAARRGELEIHRRRIDAQQQLVAMLTEDENELRDLQQRGLTTIERSTAIARERSRSQSDLIQTETLKQQSQAALSELEERLATLVGERMVSIAQDIRETNELIAALEVEIAGDRATLAASGVRRRLCEPGPLRFSVRRGGIDIEVGPDAELWPADVLTVREGACAASPNLARGP